KSISTLRTLIWLFSSMDPLVFPEIRHLTTSLSTLRTLMGLFSSVGLLMNCKSRRCRKSFGTLGAFMLFLPCVRLLMSDDILSFFLCTPFARMDPLHVSYKIRKYFLNNILDSQSLIFSICSIKTTQNNTENKCISD